MISWKEQIRKSSGESENSKNSLIEIYLSHFRSNNFAPFEWYPGKKDASKLCFKGEKIEVNYISKLVRNSNKILRKYGGKYVVNVKTSKRKKSCSQKKIAVIVWRPEEFFVDCWLLKVTVAVYIVDGSVKYGVNVVKCGLKYVKKRRKRCCHFVELSVFVVVRVLLSLIALIL